MQGSYRVTGDLRTPLSSSAQPVLPIWTDLRLPHGRDGKEPAPSEKPSPVQCLISSAPGLETAATPCSSCLEAKGAALSCFPW